MFCHSNPITLVCCEKSTLVTVMDYFVIDYLLRPHRHFGLMAHQRMCESRVKGGFGSCGPGPSWTRTRTQLGPGAPEPAGEPWQGSTGPASRCRRPPDAPRNNLWHEWIRYSSSLVVALQWRSDAQRRDNCGGENRCACVKQGAEAWLCLTHNTNGGDALAIKSKQGPFLTRLLCIIQMCSVHTARFNNLDEVKAVERRRRWWRR